MKKNAVVGIGLVAAACALSCAIVSSQGGVVESLVGKAVWYLPYLALVAGVRRLVRA